MFNLKCNKRFHIFLFPTHMHMHGFLRCNICNLHLTCYLIILCKYFTFENFLLKYNISKYFLTYNDLFLYIMSLNLNFFELNRVPLSLDWGNQTIQETIHWFEDESDPSLNSNAFEVAQQIVQKHFPGNCY